MIKGDATHGQAGVRQHLLPMHNLPCGLAAQEQPYSMTHCVQVVIPPTLVQCLI
jgi:hypothetical protein